MSLKSPATTLPTWLQKGAVRPFSSKGWKVVPLQTLRISRYCLTSCSFAALLPLTFKHSLLEPAALDIRLTFWYWSFICKIFIQPWKKLSYSIEIPKVIQCYQNSEIMTCRILPNLVFFEFSFEFFSFCLFTFFDSYHKTQSYWIACKEVCLQFGFFEHFPLNFYCSPKRHLE